MYEMPAWINEFRPGKNKLKAVISVTAHTLLALANAS